MMSERKTFSLIGSLFFSEGIVGSFNTNKDRWKVLKTENLSCFIRSQFCKIYIYT